MKITQLQLFSTTPQHIISPPLIKSPESVVRMEVAVMVSPDTGELCVAMQAQDHYTDELFEWRLRPVVVGREYHHRELAEVWRQFLAMYQEHTAPF